MLPLLRGMFALAIWDARERSLFMARDQLGIKPLYYADVNGTLRFGSQVKALLRDPCVSRDPSPAGLTGFHVTGSVPEPYTIYQSINALAAGHWIKCEAGSLGPPKRYSNVAASLIAKDRAPINDLDVRTALRDSVRHHLVADVDVGAFLSGGIDSAALVGLMRDCGQSRIRACTLTFREFAGTAADEMPGAIRIAQLYGADHYVREVGPLEFADDLEAIFDAMDQPSVDGINTWFASKACREMGVSVALSGQGGDELFAGYSTFQSVPRINRFGGLVGRMPGAERAARFLISTFAPELVRRNPKILGILRYAGSLSGSYLLRRAVLLPFELDGAMNPDTARQGLAELGLLQKFEDSVTPDPGSDNARVCALETSNYLRNQLLRDADWAGMAHSLEIRVPLADFTLMETIASRIAVLKPGEGKRLLAAAPSVPIPQEIARRPKVGFGIPVGDWLRGEVHHQEDRRTSRNWAQVVKSRYDQSIEALPTA
jgi:asparagine synthase (glutamine-hydrolysing)